MERKNKIILTGCILLVLAVTAGIMAMNIFNKDDEAGRRFEDASGNAKGQSISEKTVFGEFQAQDLDGNAVSGNIWEEAELTMVNVWATYCSPCLSEMPALGELQKEYEEKGVQIVGICIDTLLPDGTVNEDNVSLAQEIVGKTGADYTHIIPDRSLYKTIAQQVSGVPTTYFLNREGKLVGDPLVGAREKDNWAQELEKALETVKNQSE